MDHGLASCRRLTTGSVKEMVSGIVESPALGRSLVAAPRPGSPPPSRMSIILVHNGVNGAGSASACLRFGDGELRGTEGEDGFPHNGAGLKNSPSPGRKFRWGQAWAWPGRGLGVGWGCGAGLTGQDRAQAQGRAQGTGLLPPLIGLGCGVSPILAKIQNRHQTHSYPLSQALN